MWISQHIDRKIGLTDVFFALLSIPPTTLLQVWENVFQVNIQEAASAEPYIPEQLACQITSKSVAVKRIGFIGLGAMGFGMATHLLKSNFCVIGYDVIPPAIYHSIVFLRWEKWINTVIVLSTTRTKFIYLSCSI